MESMVEKVARAIQDNMQAVLPEGVSVDYRYAARAAIEAMMEPTKAMIDAAHNVPSDHAKDHWAAMICAALNEEVAG